MYTWQEVLEALKQLFTLIWPTFLNLTMNFVVPMASTLYLGHLGEDFLASSSLGNMVANASGVSIAIGLSQVLDTLCTQAYGAKEYKLVGLYLQRAMAILTVACLPIIGIWMLTEKVLLAGNVAPEVAHLAQIWVYWLMAGLWPLLMFEAFKRFLLAQSITIVQTITIFIGTAFHILNTYLLVHVAGLGFQGAAMSTSITYWVMFLLSVTCYLGYLKYKRWKGETGPIVDEDEDLTNIQDGSVDSEDSTESSDLIEKLQKSDESDEQLIEKPKKFTPTIALEDPGITSPVSDALDTWPTPNLRNIFGGWGEYLKLGIPAAASLFIEWGSYEVNALIIAQSINHTASGLPGEHNSTSAPLATHAVLSNTAGFWYMGFIAIGSACTTLLGNSLGSKEPEKAKLYVYISLALVTVYSIANGGAAVGYRYFWASLWSNDIEVIDMIARCMWVMWLYSTMDAVKCIGISVLRGCGKYNYTVIATTISCIFIGWPTSYLLGVHFMMSTFGVWLGMSLAWFCASVILLFVLFRIDWHQEMLDSQERTEKGLNSYHHEG